MVSIVSGAYLVARKFKKIHLVNYSVLRIFLILSFVYVGTCLFYFVYTVILIKYFRLTKDKFRRAIIAATIPGIPTIPRPRRSLHLIALSYCVISCAVLRSYYTEPYSLAFKIFGFSLACPCYMAYRMSLVRQLSTFVLNFGLGL